MTVHTSEYVKLGFRDRIRVERFCDCYRNDPQRTTLNSSVGKGTKRALNTTVP
jgi:hypothetical protein